MDKKLQIRVCVSLSVLLIAVHLFSLPRKLTIASHIFIQIYRVIKNICAPDDYSTKKAKMF
jgi:hypothetical protein